MCSSVGRRSALHRLIASFVILLTMPFCTITGVSFHCQDADLMDDAALAHMIGLQTHTYACMTLQSLSLHVEGTCNQPNMQAIPHVTECNYCKKCIVDNSPGPGASRRALYHDTKVRSLVE